MTSIGYAMNSGSVAIMAEGIGRARRKKLGWFKRLVAKWSKEAWENAKYLEDEPELIMDQKITSNELKLYRHNHIRFSIYAAQGGFVIEAMPSTSDSNTKYVEPTPTLVIVKELSEIGTAIERIIAVEALRA